MVYQQYGAAPAPHAEFRMTTKTPAQAMLPMIPLLVLLGAVLLLLGSLGGLIVGIIVAVVGTGGAVAFLLVKLSRTAGANVLQILPSGVRWDSGGGIVHNVGWQDFTGIGVVNTQLTPRRTLHAGGVPHQTSVSMTHHGLHGWSMVQLPPRVPQVMRQAMANMPVDQASGKRMIGIPVALFDPNWVNGPIGGWVRRYRPDLFGR